MARWKILRGVHCDKNATPVELVQIKGVERVPGDGVFYGGDVIDTDKDLSRFNVSTEVKFEKLPESEPQDELDGKTVDELKELALREKIEIPIAVKKKAQLIKAIRGVLNYRAAVA